jgi:RND family efflux transporter MFP subunit
MKTLSKLVLGLSLSAAGLAWVGPADAQGRRGGGEPAAVETAQARMVTMAPQSWAPGTVLTRRDSNLSAEVGGRVVWTADVGERVEAGSPVARLDDRRLRLAVTEAEAAITRLEAQLELARKTRQRAEELQSRGAGSQTTLDQAEAEVASVSADLNSARANLERLQLDVAQTTLRAPFAGQIAERFMEIGEYASVGEEVVRLLDLDNKEAVARAPLAAARYLESGDSVTLRTDAGDVVSGEVRALVETGTAVSRVVEVRATLPDERTWVVGEAVSLAAPTGEERAVLGVPRDALVVRREGAFVFRISDADEEGRRTAERISVRLGGGSGDFVEVTGDVSEGDSLVVRGAERLRDGQTVNARHQGS